MWRKFCERMSGKEKERGKRVMWKKICERISGKREESEKRLKWKMIWGEKWKESAVEKDLGERSGKREESENRLKWKKIGKKGVEKEKRVKID